MCNKVGCKIKSRVIFSIFTTFQLPQEYTVETPRENTDQNRDVF